jgi:signal transduction histidine kinase
MTLQMQTLMLQTSDYDNPEQELERIQQSYAWMSDSVAFIGHELRNGLMRLRLATARLQQDLAASSEEQQQAVIRVTTCAKMLELMAINCLRLAQLDDPHFRPLPSEIDVVGKVIMPLLADYADMMALREQTWEIIAPDGGQRILADGDLLNLVVGNLINNAIKYGQPGGKIIVEISSEQDGTDVISVWNSGVGVPDHLIERIFDRFETSGSFSAHSTGIGLYLVRRIVEAHDGTVRCESKPGEWARFSVKLPQSTFNSHRR